MSRDALKAALEREKRTWLEKRREQPEILNGCDNGDTGSDEDGDMIKFASVTQLMAILSQGLPPHELLHQWGIRSHHVRVADCASAEQQHAVDRSTSPRLVKRLRTENANASSTTVYSSHNIWITGFVRFHAHRDSSNGAALCICDATHRIPILLLDPDTYLLDKIVLLQRWRYVCNKSTPDVSYIEVNTTPVVLLQDTRSSLPTLNDVQANLEKNFIVNQDPPLYCGNKLWQLPSQQGRATSTRLHAPSKKKRKKYVVFGVISSVSPVAVQPNPSNSHFFIEVEHINAVQGTQSVVNVLLAGPVAIRWRVFLRPRFLVLVTELKKVYSEECGMFLLQASLSADEERNASSELRIWNDLSVELHPSKGVSIDFRDVSRRLFRVGMSVGDLSEGDVLDYEGCVTGIQWDECLILDGSSGALVPLFHYPWTDVLLGMRIGTRIRVRGAHIIFKTTMRNKPLVLGVCPRSHIAIIGLPREDAPLLPKRTQGKSRRVLHKWHLFGDFYCQPLAISMWWLELFRVLVEKFWFGSDCWNESTSSDFVSFPCVRRREATRAVGHALGMRLHARRTSSQTLASRFLSSHSSGERNCSSVFSVQADGNFPSGHVVTIRDVKYQVNERVIKLLNNAKSYGEEHDHSAISWPVEIDSNEFPGWYLVGCIRGNIQTSDLELCDKTDAISCVVLSETKNFSLMIEKECAVHHVSKFTIIVERVRESEGQADTGNIPLLAVSIRTSLNDLHRVLLCSEKHDRHKIQVPTHHTVDSANNQCFHGCGLVMFVTYIDPLKRRRLTPTCKLPTGIEFRHIHGVGLKTRDIGGRTNLPDFSSAHRVHLMLPVQPGASQNSGFWFVQKFRWYRVDGVRAMSNTRTVVTSSSAQHLPLDVRLVLWLQTESAIKFPDDTDSDTLCVAAEDIWDELDATGKSCEMTLYSPGNDQGTDIVPLVVRNDKLYFAGGGIKRGHPSEEADTKCSGSAENLLAVDDARCTSMMAVLQHLAIKADHVLSVRDLFIFRDPSDHRLISGQREANLHNARLVSIVGIVTDRELYMKQKDTKNRSAYDQEAGMATKRRLPTSSSKEATAPLTSRMCCLRIRDLCSLESITIHVDTDVYGYQSALQCGVVVEFSKLQCFLARASFKPYLGWTHATTARAISPSSPVATSAEIFGAMPTTRLTELYRNPPTVDRTVHRFAVRVVHVSYVVIKRKCNQCRGALRLIKRQGLWTHADDTSDSGPLLGCGWRHAPVGSPLFQQATHLSASMRCIIDDGSAQAELFLENDIVWEMLQCSKGRRQRFEDMMTAQTFELSYFASRTPGAALFTSTTAQEHEYYQNEWYAFVQAALKTNRSVVVFAHRFYKAAKHGNAGANAPLNASPATATVSVSQTAILTFGKDIQITTPTRSLPQLEALRVDERNARHELQRRLQSWHKDASTAPVSSTSPA